MVSCDTNIILAVQTSGKIHDIVHLSYGGSVFVYLPFKAPHSELKPSAFLLLA